MAVSGAVPEHHCGRRGDEAGFAEHCCEFGKSQTLPKFADFASTSLADAGSLASAYIASSHHVHKMTSGSCPSRSRSLLTVRGSGTLSDGEDQSMDETISQRLQICLNRLRAGDEHVYEELWHLVDERLTVLTRRMKRGSYRRVGAWAQTEDIAQNARIRLLRALRASIPATVRDFFGLVNLQIRRELLDVIRKNIGRKGDRAVPVALVDGDDITDESIDPEILAMWQEFHLAVESLPTQEQEAFGLWWYQGLSHEEAGNVLGVDKSVIKRRCRVARESLARVVPLLDELEAD